MPDARTKIPRTLALALVVAGCASHEHSDAAQTDPPTITRLGFWNVRKLGEDARKDVARLCTLIDDHFDVIALAEVMADDTTGDVAALHACLSRSFTVLQTSEARPRGTGPHREHSAVWLRNEHAMPCDGVVSLRYAPPPAAWATQHEGDAFLRPPAFGCIALADGTRVLLGVYHARWGTGEAAMVAEEIVWLDDVLGEASGDFDGEPNVVLLGDLNLAPAAVSRASGLRTHTTGGGSTLSPSGEPTTHLYDQMLFGPTTALPLTDAHVLDLREAAGGPSAYHRGVSDHLPIVSSLAHHGGR